MTVQTNRERTVVIVDDSRTIQAMLETVFETCGGFKVVGVASSAEAAATMIARVRPDIVTIDFCMPYIDGAALLGMLTDLPEVCKIVISDHAASNVAMVEKLRASGAAACIGKQAISGAPQDFRRTLMSIISSFEAARFFTRTLPSPDFAAPRGGGVPPAQTSVFGYPVPADERQRLAYIRRKQLANATPERQFDQLTQYFAQLSEFPVCLMTFIDKDTQWLKSAYGFPVSSMPRCEAFCNYTIAQDSTFIVRNAANDPMFASNPLVTGDTHVRTYVGHPIITDDGIHAGALCVLDTRVRSVSNLLIARLKGLAEIASEMVNRRPLLAA